jgi:hypothetical protein
MTHLDISYTIHGKKKGQESNWQFDSTIKCWESTRLSCVQVACDTPLESSRQELQLCFRPHLDRRSKREVIAPQSCGTSNLDNFGTPFESPGTKSHFDVTLTERCRVYYMGEGGGFLRVRAMVSLVNLKLSVAYPSTKGAPT